MSIIQRFKIGLQKSSNYLTNNIANSLKSNKISEEILDQIESILISADIGLDVTNLLIEKLKKIKDNKIVDKNYILETIATEIEDILKKREDLFIKNNEYPQVLMFVGVNGSGKTTTIGKLINSLKNNKKLLIVACDTFRAAAVDQLKEWSNRNDVDFFEGNLNEDPASVAFKACEKAKKNKYDIIMIDTAGRLSSNTNLINQLIKIKSVINKSINNKKLRNILVLDGTNGSNMISQVKIFSNAIDISSLIITKLDGTAKGGAIIPIASKYQIPIHFIGLGEKEDDLQIFNAKAFAYSLLDIKS